MTENDEGTPGPWHRPQSDDQPPQQPQPQPAQPYQQGADQPPQLAQPYQQGGYLPTAEYYPEGVGQGYPQYGMPPVSTTYAPRPKKDQPRPGSRKLLAGATAIALLVGGVAGGVGGYLVSEQGVGSTVNSLEAPPPAKQTGNAPNGSIEAVAQKVTPSVVQLQVAGGGRAGEGSGFIITDDGYILTNNHVIEAAADGGGEIKVLFADGKRATGEVVGRDPTSDVAVVKAKGATGLTPVDLGRSDDLRVGQAVVAIGSPFQLSGTVTSGIVSSLHRPVRAGGTEGDQTTVMDAIQTDAAINPGNSGGPLADMSGNVIGINSAIYSPQAGSSGSQGGAGNVGIGFAIPIDQARRTADELIETGQAKQTYIGASVRDASDGGAAIVEVLPNSPSEEAGLKAGDVVTKLGDRLIADADELVAAIRTRAPGETVTLTLRNNKTLQIKLGSKPVEGG